MGFAQIGSEVDDGEPTEHETYLAQIAVVLAHMPKDDVDIVGNYLA